MKKQVDKLIDALKNAGSKNVDLYTGTKRNFKFYYNLSGFIGKDYYDFTISRHKKVKITEVEIHKTTECKVKINELVRTNITDQTEIKWV